MSITDPIKNALLIGLSATLLLSIGGNLWLFNSRDEALSNAATASKAANDNAETAKECGKSVTRLEEEAKARAKAHKPAVETAKQQARTHVITAQELLAASPVKPGDACASADTLARKWLEDMK